jgi:hypothetical protein
MKSHRSQRGAAAVELGILLIPLILLTFGVTEFGRAIYQYNTLLKATRDATRFLSGQGPGDPADVTVAQCLVVYGNRTCAGNALAPGLNASMVNICDSSNCLDHKNQPTGSGVINIVSVTVSNYRFTSLVPFAAPDVNFGPIRTTMRQVL